MTKDMRTIVYPAIIGVLGLCLLGLLLSRTQISITTERDRLMEQQNSPNPALSPAPSSPAVSPSPSPASPSPIASPTAPATASPPPAASAGSLRVSNRSPHPVRVALLAQAGADKAADAAFGQPVHWDFAPQEGSGQGLILSLPDSKLQVQSGDVLMAFAQDGSRRYWGPYVVGKTALPAWNADRREWQLLLPE